MLAFAIGSWVGGFDVLYACQDLDFDRAHGLRSIPVRFGVAGSLAISRAMHLLAIVCLAALGFVAPLGAVYFVGVAAVAAMLAYEQSLVQADDLSQVKRAFDLNGYVGILYLIVIVVSLLSTTGAEIVCEPAVTLIAAAPVETSSVSVLVPAIV